MKLNIDLSYQTLKWHFQWFDSDPANLCKRIISQSWGSWILTNIDIFTTSHTYTVLLFSAAKSEMVKSKLPNTVLGKIWKLSDVDHDGFLDGDEFALAMHLINVKLDGHDLPPELPRHLVPPSKRKELWALHFIWTHFQWPLHM